MGRHKGQRQGLKEKPLSLQTSQGHGIELLPGVESSPQAREGPRRQHWKLGDDSWVLDIRGP